MAKLRYYISICLGLRKAVETRNQEQLVSRLRLKLATSHIRVALLLHQPTWFTQGPNPDNSDLHIYCTITTDLIFWIKFVFTANDKDLPSPCPVSLLRCIHLHATEEVSITIASVEAEDYKYIVSLFLVFPCSNLIHRQQQSLSVNVCTFPVETFKIHGTITVTFCNSFHTLQNQIHIYLAMYLMIYNYSASLYLHSTAMLLNIITTHLSPNSYICHYLWKVWSSTAFLF